jgi:hypothetical protein
VTDRHAGYVVTLKEDIREDDAEQFMSALRFFSFVASVTPVVSDVGLHIATEKARYDLLTKLREALKP